MSFRNHLPAPIKDVPLDTAITVGAISLGLIATLVNVLVGDKTEALAFLLLTIGNAYQGGELNPQRMQQRRQQVTSMLFKPASANVTAGEQPEALKPKIN